MISVADSTLLHQLWYLLLIVHYFISYLLLRVHYFISYIWYLLLIAHYFISYLLLKEHYFISYLLLITPNFICDLLLIAYLFVFIFTVLYLLSIVDKKWRTWPVLVLTASAITGLMSSRLVKKVGVEIQIWQDFLIIYRTASWTIRP